MRKFLFLVALPLIMSACGQSDEVNSVETAPQSAEQRRVEINELEKGLLSKSDLTAGTNKAKAEHLVRRYRDYVNMNPHDSISAEYLFKAADLNIGLGNYEASIKYLDRLTTDFPDYNRIVEIWLFKGFIYENYMNSHANAVSTYDKLIERYPNHRLAADAQAAKDNLTLTDEELMEKFKKVNENKGV